MKNRNVVCITKEDYNLLVEIEDLLHKKLMETVAITDTYEGNEYTYFPEDCKEYDTWNKYWNFVEELAQAFDKLLDKSTINNISEKGE